MWGRTGRCRRCSAIGGTRQQDSPQQEPLSMPSSDPSPNPTPQSSHRGLPCECRAWDLPGRAPLALLIQCVHQQPATGEAPGREDRALAARPGHETGAREWPCCCPVGATGKPACRCPDMWALRADGVMGPLRGQRGTWETRDKALSGLPFGGPGTGGAWGQLETLTALAALPISSLSKVLKADFRLYLPFPQPHGRDRAS